MQIRPSRLACALALLGPALVLPNACVESTVGAPDGAAISFVEAFTVAVLPDTQFYACGYPDIFQRQTQWIADHRVSHGIGLVVHTGDIVDSDVAAQWDVAATALHTLDGLVPYLLVSGNHDIVGTRQSMMDRYFDPNDAAAGMRVPTTREPGRFDNAFMRVELAGQPWLFIGLEFGARDAVVAWANDVLAAHADVPAVLFTHAYLYSDGTRYDRAVQPYQSHHPDQYAITPDEGINDGEDLWRKLIEPHENVRLVLSGHAIPDGTARSIATRASGTRVHQVLANYQYCDACPCAESEGGGGYLRLLEFDAGAEHIEVTTYSPHLDVALRDAENEFTLEL